MRVFKNADYQSRLWPDLQRPDGRTLELEPDEEIELSLPDDFADPYLVPVAQPKKAKKQPEQEPLANA